MVFTAFVYSYKRHPKTRQYVLPHNASNMILGQVGQIIEVLHSQEHRPHVRPTILVYSELGKHAGKMKTQILEISPGIHS